MKNPPTDNPKRKVCYGCQESKPLSEFNKCKTGIYELHNHCKVCQKETKRKWYLKNRESELKKSAEYSKTEKAKIARKKRWEENKDVLGPKNNAHRRTPESRKKARTQRRKWLSAPQNRIAHNVRIRIRKALKGVDKSESTIQILGADLETVKNYLESKFAPGMSWDNYGDWHIDHIKPCASFDLTKEEEQRQCFHYTNLQPLWKFDNQSKGCRI